MASYHQVSGSSSHYLRLTGATHPAYISYVKEIYRPYNIQLMCQFIVRYPPKKLRSCDGS